MKKGFTLIEMLVAVGIIATLIAALLGGYSAMIKSAERARATDLVKQVATALSALYEANGGAWPLRIAKTGETGGELDDLVAYSLVEGNTKYLALMHSGGKLIGNDRFGVLDPWGLAIMKQRGQSATLESVRKHLLWFAVDTDGDGIISGAKVGGEEVNVRATAIVWCAGKDGNMEPYSKGLRRGGIYSWTVGQTKDVK